MRSPSPVWCFPWCARCASGDRQWSPARLVCKRPFRQMKLKGPERYTGKDPEAPAGISVIGC